MNINLLITFIALNVLNVIIQTVKSLATVKCGKGVAAIVNAVAYGLYTIVLVYTVCDLPLFLKASVVAVANLVGVYVVKWFEEKARKDKLWKIEATFDHDLDTMNVICDYCKKNALPMNYLDIEKYFIVNFFCATQAQSLAAKHIIELYNGKYFVSETKVL